ncbi:MAG: porin [Rickettsiales bacterium]|nr:porin [Rickettsiales bacterium]
MNLRKIILVAFVACLDVANADAFEYNHGGYGFKLNGYGTIGVIEPDFDEPSFIGDWRVRTQFNYALGAGRSIGAIYAIDELALYQNEWQRDAFLFFENAEIGRIEVGFTDSIATKLGVGLPDVGSLRINDNPLFYKKIDLQGAVLSNTTLTGGRYDLRANIVSVPTKPMQYGVSIAGLSPNYDYAVDFGVKYRKSEGKTKVAVSFGASFIDSPENFQPDVFAPRVTADWRAQTSAGLNLQYNSWIWGLSGRIVYDRNPIAATDGIVAGTGISYDILKYSLSASYLLSDTGVWDSDAKDYVAHTAMLSFRYKYSESLNGWMSLGISAGLPFLGAGLNAKF